MDKIIKILHVEDSSTDAELIERELTRAGFFIDTVRVETHEQFIEELGRFSPDLILSDFSLPKFDGLTALEIASKGYPDISFIFVSGTISEEVAIAALRGGAADYVLKTNMKRLAPAVARVLNDSNARIDHKRAEARTRDLIEFAPNAIVVINERGFVEIINARTEALFGYTKAELVGNSYLILGDHSKHGVLDRIADFKQKFKSMSGPDAVKVPFPPFKAQGRRRDGTEFWAEIFLSPMIANEELWICGSVVDITDRIAQEDRISRLFRIQTVLSSINAAGIRIRDQTALCLEVCEILVNDGAFKLAWAGTLTPGSQNGKVIAWAGAGTEYVEHIQLTSVEFSEGGQRPPSIAYRLKKPVVCNNISMDPSLQSVWDIALRNGFSSMVALPLLAGDIALGVLVIYAAEIDFFSQDEMQLLTRLANDVSFVLEHQQTQQRLSFLAFHDSLTELPNRLLFIERLQAELFKQRSSPDQLIALVLVDINRFRNINDTLGREAGDKVLLEVKSRLQGPAVVSQCSARVDSNCFAFVIRSDSPDVDLTASIERELVVRMTAPVYVGGKEIRISYRAGLALSPEHGNDAVTLLRNAEAALRSAKSSRVHHQRYDVEMDVQMADMHSMETRLKQALEKNQFTLHYQPKIDLVRRKIVGLEALIRWNDPDHGLIPPAQFISIMEETGLIIDVGAWVIQEACRQYQAWTADGLNVPKIAVNVSQLQLRQNNFVENFLAMVGPVGVGALEIEITESLFADDLNESIERLEHLRNEGVSIAIDDFGTGYSSLSYIARLPVNVLKIDRSFVNDMTSSANHMAIVSTIISLAHGLNLQVVAEGVETEEQSKLLKLLRCDQAQGYLFSRPLQADMIKRLLEEPVLDAV